MIRKIMVFIFALLPLHAMATICPASYGGGQGISDGCTTSIYVQAIGDDVNLGTILPSVGLFRSTFTPSCNQHDICYTTLGANYDQCDSDFYSRMTSACQSDFPPWFLPNEFTECARTALQYYQAVTLYRTSLRPDIALGFQIAARNRSIQMQWNVDADTCGTTPERTAIYTPELIAKINNSFLIYAGRTPTIYEFLTTVNSGNIASDPAGWESVLYNSAVYAAYVQPPSVGYQLIRPGHDDGLSVQYVTFQASPAEANANYLWNFVSNAYGPTVTYAYNTPAYSYIVNYSGYLKATNSSGVRNMALIEANVNIKGSCGSGIRRTCN